MYNVMLVDDEPFIIDGLEILVNWDELNLTVIKKASNGQQALEFMKHNNVDILITDIKMPKMNGLELISKAKDVNPDCKYLILSGYNDFEYLKEAIKLGLENYLTKPVNIEELTATLRKTVDTLNTMVPEEFFSPDNNEWHIIRNNILSRWVNDLITPAELQTRANLLNLITDSPYYTVAIINIDQSDVVNIQLSKIHRICYKYIKNEQTIMAFEDTDGNFVLIFTSQCCDNYKLSINNILLQIQNNLLSLNVKVHITLGTTATSYKFLSKSYSSAKNLFDYFLIYPDTPILCAAEIESTNLNIEDVISIDHEFIYSNITLKNKDKLFEYIDKFFDQLISTSGITPVQLKMVVIKILLRLYKTVNNTSVLFESDIMKEHVNLLSRIHTINDLELLKQQLKDYFSIIINKFTKKESSTNPVVYQILKYIHTHYDKELSLKTLSYQFNINPTYLGQLFKKETGTSFPNYVNNYRIERAKELLLESNLKTTQIAKKIGYIDTNYFYRIFKKYTNLSPTDYKELN